MIVVSDTTPLRYLAVIGGLEWLPALFGKVACPPEVVAECRHPHAPRPLRDWGASPPHWLEIIPVSPAGRSLPLDVHLHAGETAALQLAFEIHADLVLMDEKQGRRTAARLGLSVTGTLGVTVEAALRGWTDFDTALTRLVTQTNFRTNDAVISAARSRLAAGRIEKPGKS